MSRLAVKVRGLLAVTLFMYAIAAAAAQPKVFTVGVQDLENYLPYSEYKAGAYLGFNRKLLDLFAQSRGYQFVYQPLPLMRLYRDFVAGRFDFKYPDNAYWSADFKGDTKIHYSDPVVEYIDGVMVLPENKGRGIEQIKNLGLILGFTPAPYQRLIDSAQLIPFQSASYQRLLRKTMLGQLDGFYSNIAVADKYLSSSLGKPGALVFDDQLPFIKSTRHLSTIEHPEVIAEFNRFLLDSRDEITELKREYGLAD